MKNYLGLSSIEGANILLSERDTFLSFTKDSCL